MLLFKKNFALSTTDQDEIKRFFSHTIESMLSTREATLNAYKKFDVVLLCSVEGNYLVIDIYQLSKFTPFEKKSGKNYNVPFYRAARSLSKYEETIIYIDDHKEKGLRIKNAQAFYHICDLLETFDVDAFSVEKYKCVW